MGKLDRSLPKINYEKIVNADRAHIFDIVTDYKSFAKLLPRYFPSIRIRSTRDNVTIAEQHVRLYGKELVMMTKHVIVEYPVLHEVFVIGGDARGSHITERYEKIPEGTKIIIHADIKLGGIMNLAGPFVKSKIRNDMIAITDELAKLAEN